MTSEESFRGLFELLRHSDRAHSCFSEPYASLLSSGVDSHFVVLLWGFYLVRNFRNVVRRFCHILVAVWITLLHILTTVYYRNMYLCLKFTVICFLHHDDHKTCNSSHKNGCPGRYMEGLSRKYEAGVPTATTWRSFISNFPLDISCWSHCQMFVPIFWHK
jgi:hypothetical protein